MGKHIGYVLIINTNETDCCIGILYLVM